MLAAGRPGSSVLPGGRTLFGDASTCPLHRLERMLMRIQSCTVLIIDSKPAERHAYRQLLIDDPVYQYTFWEAEQGAQALALCQETKPACILLAAHLPDMDGLTLLHDLRSLLGAHGAAFIIVASTADEALVRRAIQNGAHDYLYKDYLYKDDLHQDDLHQAETAAQQMQRILHHALEKSALQRTIARQQRWLHTLANRVGEDVLITDATGQLTLMNEATAPTLRNDPEQSDAAAAQEGERRFRQLADAMPQIVWTTTPTGMIDYFNEQWFAFTGLSVEASFADANVAIHPADRAAAVAAWQAAQPEGIAYEYEMRLRRHDGAYHWFLTRCVPDYNGQGQISRWYGTSTDITARKVAEEQLRYQALLLENVQDAIISTDTNFHIVSWNRGAERLYGWLAMEAVGRSVRELLQTTYLDVQPLDVRNTFMTNGRWQGEVTQCNRKGEWITVSNITVLLRDSLGRPLGAVAVNRDITARKVAETVQRRSEQLLRNIIDNVAAFVGLMTPDGILIEANRTALQAANLTLADVIGKHFADTYWWSYAEAVQAQLRAAIAQTVNGETVRYDATVRLSDEQYIVIDFMLAPIFDEQGQVIYLVPSAVDVTERRQAEAALRESEAHFRSLFASLTQGVVYHNAQGQIIDANRAAEEILGLSLAQMQGRAARDPRWLATRADGSPFPGDEHPAMVALRTGKIVQRTLMGVFHPRKNEQRWLLVDAVPQFHIGEDQPYQAYALFSDFTERRQAEAALRASAERLRLALAGGRMGIWEWYAATGRSIWDEQEYALFGLPYGTEITYEVFERFIYPEDWVQLKNILDTAMSNGGDYNHEFRIVRTDGEVRWLAEYAVGIRDEQHGAMRLLGINFDITERKVQEEALHQLTIELEARVVERTAALKAANEKLEVTNHELEHFTYAAAHDLKSPLRGIQNLVQFLMEDAAVLLPAKSQKHLSLLQGRAYRLEQLLNGLLDYSRIGREHYVTETVNTRALVEEISELLAPPASFSITAAASLPTLVTHRVPLATVLRNLISNAIKHHHQPLLGQVRVTARSLDHWIEFRVVDNGPGIDPEFHKRIFDMFQTLQSRDIVEGSGIGLALVKKIVESYGGQITVDSALGQGATFAFAWPKVL